MLEHHPLVKEFPELHQRLHELKEDAHFAKIMTKYEELDKKIFNMEATGEFTDSQIEEMKKERIKLKDEIYAKIK